MIEQLNAMTNQEKFDYMKKWVENEEIMHKKIFLCAHKNLMSYLGNDDFFCIQNSSCCSRPLSIRPSCRPL